MRSLEAMKCSKAPCCGLHSIPTKVNRLGPMQRPRRTALQTLHLGQKLAATTAPAPTPTSDSPTTDSSADVEAPSSGPEKIDWERQWYPVAIEADLAPDRPHAVRLLGNPLVIWRDGEGAWRAFKDVCPHRLVALSEGRVENGNLMCSYHGWQFEGCGKLAAVPQADNANVLETAINSRRSSCQVHACQVEDGLIWVYGKAGAEEEARRHSIQDVLLPRGYPDSFRMPFFQRDLPYGSDTLVENLLDPSHVPITHTGVGNLGNRHKIHKTCMARGEAISPKGFSVLVKEPDNMPDSERRKGGEFPYTLSYTAPAFVRYDHKERLQLGFYAVPTDPGRCRAIFTVMIPRLKPKGLPALLVKLLKSKYGLWYEHFTRNDTLDGDNFFLAMQDRDMRRKKAEGQNAARFFYMPTSLDLGVAEWHRWLAKFGGSFPWGAGALDPEPIATSPRSEKLNRLESHTKNCFSCSWAHKTFGRLQWVAGAVSVVSFLAAAHSLAAGFTFRKLALPVTGFLAAGVALLSRSFTQRLEFVDYRHPDH